VSRGDFPGKRPVYEQAVAHFQVRMGLTNESLWTLRGRDVAIGQSGYEITGWSLDHPGWGALTFRRPPFCAGDPISGFSNGIPVFAIHRLPNVIQAANYDYLPGEGEGHTYHDITPTNSTGEYRANAVDIALDPNEGLCLADIAAGEWLTYTVNVASNGTYRFAIRYAAANGNSTVRLAVGTNSVTGEMPLPSTASLSTWQTFTVVNAVALQRGVHALRIFFGGQPSLRVKSIAVNLPVATTPPILSASLSGDALELAWPAGHIGWRLETQSHASGFGLGADWGAVGGSESTNRMFLPIMPANGSAFFRLAYP